MPPPPAEGLASRLFLGPALRTQPDRRLVTLVREGYEAAFEEIVRRYGRALGRYAASIVGARSEDVLQDAFARALPALRRGDAEIDLRPWLFRIVRNTALNDLRDSPPTPELLAEALAGGRGPADELEQREELADLMRRLQALPEPQRAAIVMRELEGLGHEEIAAALGLTGGGARQVIYRARQALRDGAGMLLPLPLVRLLIDHGGEAVGASGAIAATGASAGGAGAGVLKLGVVAAVVAGSVGAGVAVQEHRGNDAAEAQPTPTASSAPTPHHRFSSVKTAGRTISRASIEPGRHGPGMYGSGSEHSSHHGSSDTALDGDQDVASHNGSSGRGPGPPAGQRGPGDGDGHDGERNGEGLEDDLGRNGGGPGPSAGSGDGGSDGSGSDVAMETTSPLPSQESSSSGDYGSGSSGGSDGSGVSGDGSSSHDGSGGSEGGDGGGDGEPTP